MRVCTLYGVVGVAGVGTFTYLTMDSPGGYCGGKHHRGSHSTLISVCGSYTELSLASLLVKYEGGIVIRVLLHFLDNPSNLAFAIVIINLQKKALVISNTMLGFFGIFWDIFGILINNYNI